MLTFPGDKVADKTEMVIILGFNPDGPDNMVLRKTTDGVGKVSSSVHVRPKIDMATGREFLVRVRADPTKATAFEMRHYRLAGDPSVIYLGTQEVKPFLTPDAPGTMRVAPSVQEWAQARATAALDWVSFRGSHGPRPPPQRQLQS
jgi:hypothetical protein